MPLHVSSTCAHRQEVKIILYSLWYHQTYRWPSRAPVHGTATYRCDDIQWRTEGGVWGVQTPPPEIPKALQNHTKFTDLRKLLKIAEFRTPAPQDVRKKGSKILKLPRFAIVLY